MEKYFVWCPDVGAYDEDEPCEVEAFDHEYASKLFAEAYDRDGDYPFMDCGGYEVFVKQVGTESIRKFIVSGESVPQYSAYEAKP